MRKAMDLIRGMFRFRAMTLPAVFLAVMAGCQTDGGDLRPAGGPMVSAPPGSISVHQLAGRLDMRVVESDDVSATLRNASNSVMIFADPGGEVYVNAAAIGDTGDIVPVGGMLFVPQSLTARVRASLRPVPPPRPAAVKPSPREMLGPVCIDAGHGGRDPGAISPIGLQEKEVNLAVALMSAANLKRRGVKVVLTRRDDRFVELNERAAIANRAGAKLFVSIHADSCGTPSVQGFTVYCARAATRQSLTAAGAMVRRLAGVVAVNRGIRRADFRVLVRTSCPAMLVELGYLSNRAEAGRLNRTRHRRRLAEAIAAAVVERLQ